MEIAAPTPIFRQAARPEKDHGEIVVILKKA